MDSPEVQEVLPASTKCGSPEVQEISRASSTMGSPEVLELSPASTTMGSPEVQLVSHASCSICSPKVEELFPVRPSIDSTEHHNVINVESYSSDSPEHHKVISVESYSSDSPEHHKIINVESHSSDSPGTMEKNLFITNDDGSRQLHRTTTTTRQGERSSFQNILRKKNKADVKVDQPPSHHCDSKTRVSASNIISEFTTKTKYDDNSEFVFAEKYLEQTLAAARSNLLRQEIKNSVVTQEVGNELLSSTIVSKTSLPIHLIQKTGRPPFNDSDPNEPNQLSSNGIKRDLEEMAKLPRSVHKKNRMKTVANEVKLALRPHYNLKIITKDVYKDILRRAVLKIYHSKSKKIEPAKIADLVCAYVTKSRPCRRLLGDMDKQNN